MIKMWYIKYKYIKERMVMNCKYVAISVAIMIILGMTACEQKKNVITDKIIETETVSIQETITQKVTIQEKLGIIQLRKDQKMNYSLRKSRSVQKGKKRKRLHFC